MPVEIELSSGSPVGSLMSCSSASTPGTPSSGGNHYSMASTPSVCDFSDSHDSDTENNNILTSAGSINLLVNERMTTDTQSDAKDGMTSESVTPKKKRYTKSRVRNKSPSLIKKLKQTRRSKANDRERTRMHNLNDALESLRKILPNASEENKLTKIETLRFAYNYIFALSQTVDMVDKGDLIPGEDRLYSAQISAAMKMPSASQTLSHIHKNHQQQQNHHHQQQQDRLNNYHSQSPQPMSVPVSQLSPVGHAPITSPTTTGQHHHHQVPFTQGMHIPMTSHVKLENGSLARCRVSPSPFHEHSQSFSTGSTTINQVQNFVSVAVSPSSVMSSSPVSHVQTYGQFTWGAPQCVQSTYSFEDPISPSGYSDTSEGYTFEMM